jgi:hypothetical protein
MNTTRCADFSNVDPGLVTRGKILVCNLSNTDNATFNVHSTAPTYAFRCVVVA